MAHTYSHLYNLPTTGLRFFTVYGPWGQPDMALFKFTKGILADIPIQVYNFGKHRRDFTYIDDIFEAIIRVLDRPAESAGQPQTTYNYPPNFSSAPWRIYNIDSNKPANLLDYIKAIEKAVGKPSKIEFLSLQPGDVPDTYADVEDLVEQFDFKPSTTIEDGITKYISWYNDYYKT